MAFIASILAFITLVSAAPLPPLRNVTIAVPQGTSDHGDPRLLCTPAKAADIATFFLGNYLAHVATIVPIPGETASTLLFFMVNTLFYPVSGVRRGVEAIAKRAVLRNGFWKIKSLRDWKTLGVFENDPLKVALRAGALCEVIRTNQWRPDVKEREAELRGMMEPKVLDEAEDTHTEPKTAILNTETSTDAGPNENAEDAIQQIGNEEPSQKTTDTHQGPPTPTDISVTNFPDECFVHSEKWWYFGGRAIHGICKLPEGYALAILPTHAKVIPCRPRSTSPSESSPGTPPKTDPVVNLSCSYPLLRALIALAQLVYASWTLYETRGDQLDRYGYAAFGLTVTPYLLVSAVNLLGSLLTPSYPKVYLVHTHIMKEASNRKGVFECIVAKLDESQSLESPLLSSSDKSALRESDDPVSVPPEQPSSWFLENNLLTATLGSTRSLATHPFRRPRRRHQASIEFLSSAVETQNNLREEIVEIIITLSSTWISLISLAIIGSLSQFKIGTSSKAQRVWTMAWLVVGIIFGPNIYMIRSRGATGINRGIRFFISLCLCLPYSALAIGGMVVVGRMLQDYGSCYRIY